MSDEVTRKFFHTSLTDETQGFWITNGPPPAWIQENLRRHAELMGSEHEHVWGPLRGSSLSGSPVRDCQVDGCRIVNVYDDDEDDMDPNEYTHMFRTMFGIPPSKDDEPVCGAVLSDAYDFPNTQRPGCPACARIARRVDGV